MFMFTLKNLARKGLRVMPKTSTTIFETIFLSDRMATRVSLSVDVHGIDVVILIDFKMSYCVL